MTASLVTSTQGDAVDWRSVVSRLFPEGHDIVQDNDLLTGSGRCGGETLAVVGTIHHVALGVEISLAIAQYILKIVREYPGRPLLLLIDTQGQRLRQRDELLGIHRYVALISKAIQVARDRGHRVIGLVYDQGVSGGILASAFSADVCGALPGAEIRVMNLPAMARITRIPEEQLRELSRKSPVFAPDPHNYVQMGAVDSIWEGDLAQCLQDALNRAQANDHRARLALERGGRLLAERIARRVADDA